MFSIDSFLDICAAGLSQLFTYDVFAGLARINIEMTTAGSALLHRFYILFSTSLTSCILAGSQHRNIACCDAYCIIQSFPLQHIMKEIETRLRTSLFSRRIPFNMYTFDNSTATIISMVRGNKLSVNLAHTVSLNDDGTFTVASYDKSKTVDSSTAAVSWIITDIRKYEILFSKYSKRN